jgi:hypothetical protein
MKYFLGIVVWMHTLIGHTFAEIGPFKGNASVGRIVLTPEHWRPLIELSRQPNCTHLKARYQATFDDLRALQDTLENESATPAELHSFADYLELQHRVNVVSLSTQKYFQIEKSIDFASYGLKREDIDLIVFQNARMSDPYEFDRFYSAPANLLWDRSLLRISADLDGLDLCQAQKIQLKVFGHCEFEAPMPDGCAENQRCAEQRVTDLQLCQQEWVFEIDLSTISELLGKRAESMKRKKP